MFSYLESFLPIIARYEQPSHLVDCPLLLLHPDGERPERVGRQHVLPHESDGDLSEVLGRGWVFALRGGGGRGPVRVALGSTGLEEMGDHHHHAGVLEKIPHWIKSDFGEKSLTLMCYLGIEIVIMKFSSFEISRSNIFPNSIYIFLPPL